MTPNSTTPDSAEAVNVRIHALCGLDISPVKFWEYAYTYAANGTTVKSRGWNTERAAELDRKGLMSGNPFGESTPATPYQEARDIPNYSGSLDAMAEAEKTLTEAEQRVYAGLLHTQDRDYLRADFVLMHTSAAQRAAAFLTTKTRTN